MSTEKFVAIVVSDAKGAIANLARKLSWLRQAQEIMPIPKEDLEELQCKLNEIDNICAILQDNNCLAVSAD